MPFCPECKCEYDYGFDTCAECKVPLVDQLPETEKYRHEIADGKEVFLCMAANQIEASIVESVLEEARILYRSSNAAYTAVGGIIGISPDMGCDYFVMERDYERASQLIEEAYEGLNAEEVTFEFPEYFDEEE